MTTCIQGRSGGLTGYAEWLNWKARRQGMDYAAFQNPVWLTPTESKDLGYDRANGMRIGVGYRFRDCWELSWNYTRFYSNDSATTVATEHPNQQLIATRSLLDTTATSVSASSSLEFDVNDIEMGRWFRLNCTTDLRLFGGFRWAIIDQDLNTEFTHNDIFHNPVQTTMENPTNLDAYGIRLGAEVRKSSVCSLSYFARGATSVLAGRFNTLQREVDEVDGTIIDFSDTYVQAVPVLEVAAGIAWTYGPLELSGGYELNTWFNMAQVDRSSYDLILDGFFLLLGYLR